MSPLMNPDMATNSSTTMLIAVKTLLIVVDSFTPKDSKPTEGTGWISVGAFFEWLSLSEAVGRHYLTESGRERQQRNLGRVRGPWGPWLCALQRISKWHRRWDHQMSRSMPVQHWMSLIGTWERDAISQSAWVTMILVLNGSYWFGSFLPCNISIYDSVILKLAQGLWGLNTAATDTKHKQSPLRICLHSRGKFTGCFHVDHLLSSVSQTCTREW